MSFVGMGGLAAEPGLAGGHLAARWSHDSLRPDRHGSVEPSATVRHKILVVDDDRVYLTELQDFLAENGFEVWSALSSRQALAQLNLNGLPHIALVDYLIPGMTGLELARALMKRCDIPIILMSGQVESPEVAEAFELVAQDHVAKPIDTLILLARIKRLLRGIGDHARTPQPRFRVDDWLELELGRCVAVVGGREVRLSPAENKLLFLLMRDAGKVLRVEYLFRKMWPSADRMNDASLRILVHRLRKKIERQPEKPRYLLTRRGLGYYFQLL